MVWVKGELLSEIGAAGVDPSAQLTRDAQAVLFDRQEWFARVEKHLPSHVPIIARAASDGALCWLMLARQGGKAEALSNWYSMAFRPVFAGDPSVSAKHLMLTAIARRLARMRPNLSRITLSPIPRADGSSALIVRAFRKGGWAVTVSQSSTSWTANVSGLSFDDYWAARPGQLRSTVKRKSAKTTFDCQILDRFDADAWAEYEAVYADSWKPEEGSPAFLRSTAEAESAAGCLRIGICRLDGIVVAAQFWTVENGVAYIHKLAHRTSTHDLSPGTILSAALFRHVIDVDQVQTIDFGTGNDPYKADWMDASAPLDEVTAYNLRTPAGLLGGAKATLSGLVRRAAND